LAISRAVDGLGIAYTLEASGRKPFLAARVSAAFPWPAVGFAASLSDSD